MKTIIWIVIALVVIGGIAWMISSNNSDSSENDDQLSENGRITDTDEKILEEIDEAINYLE